MDDAATTGHRALVWQPVLPTCVAEPVAVEVRPGCFRFISPLRCSHAACSLIQICAIGPWPFALLHELYYSVKTLAEDLLGVAVKAPHVVCPRCHQTTGSLTMVQDKALKGESWLCEQVCRALTAAGPGVTTDQGKARCDAVMAADDEAAADDAKDDDNNIDTTLEALEGRLDMGTLGFATWLVGLDKATTKSQRLDVVTQAIASAQKAVEAVISGATVQAGEEPAADASQATVIAKAQVQHVCRLVER